MMQNKGTKIFLFLNICRTPVIKAVVLTRKLRKHDEKITETFKQLCATQVHLLQEIFKYKRLGLLSK